MSEPAQQQSQPETNTQSKDQLQKVDDVLSEFDTLVAKDKDENKPADEPVDLDKQQ